MSATTVPQAPVEETAPCPRGCRIIWLSELLRMRARLIAGGHRELLQLLDAAEAERLQRQPNAAAFRFMGEPWHRPVLDRELARVRAAHA